MRKERDYPRGGIRHEKPEYGVEPLKLKTREYPQQAQSARSKQRYYRRRHRILHTAYRAHYAVHKSAGEIHRTDKAHSYQSRLNNFRTGVVYAEQRRPEHIRKVSEHYARSRGTGTGYHGYAVHTAVSARSDIRAGKGESPLRERVHRYPDEALDA